MAKRATVQRDASHRVPRDVRVERREKGTVVGIARPGMLLRITRRRIAAMLSLALVMSGGSAPGNAGDVQSAAPWSATTMNPVSWYRWGADVRLRHDASENPSLTQADPPGHDFGFERLRLREWNALAISEASTLYLRFTWEGRHYAAPESKAEWQHSEVAFDAVTATHELGCLPLTVIVGRQDIAFGDGWLVSDGTPLDGPRTFYFDAIRATLALDSLSSTLDVIYIDQFADGDHRLRPFFSNDSQLMEQDERGVIVHFSDKASPATPFETYFIYKHDAAVQTAGDSGEVYSVGGRVFRNLAGSVRGRLESVYQFGRRENAVMLTGHERKLSAWGLNGRITWCFPAHSGCSLWLGCEVLSGHDAGDDGNHQFDPLWGRWAQYSELFPNDLDRPGDRSNLRRLNLGWERVSAGGTVLQANYHAVFAYANRKAGTAGFSDHARFKGHLLTVLLRRTFSPHWSGLVLGEYFVPGDYYEPAIVPGPLDSRDDPAAFLRCQLVFTL